MSEVNMDVAIILDSIQIHQGEAEGGGKRRELLTNCTVKE